MLVISIWIFWIFKCSWLLIHGKYSQVLQIPQHAGGVEIANLVWVVLFYDLLYSQVNLTSELDCTPNS